MGPFGKWGASIICMQVESIIGTFLALSTCLEHDELIKIYARDGYGAHLLYN